MVESNYTNNSSGNYNQIQIFQVESSKDPQQGKKLRNEIEFLANQFIDLDHDETRILRDKKKIILEMADKFEQLHEIGEYIFPITQICSDIYKYLSKKGYSISKTYVYEVIKDFAPQYSNNHQQNENSNSDDDDDVYQKVNSGQIDIQIIRKKVEEASEFLYKLNPNLLSRHQIQDIIPKHDEFVANIIDFAKRHDILIVNSGEESSTPNYDSSEADPFKDPVITDKPGARPSNLSDASFRLAKAFYLLSKTIEANAKMMVDYPPDPNDVELEIKGVNDINEMADFIEQLDISIKGGTDRKYRRSILQWAAITDDEETWGKHAASSKNPYIARFKDKDGNWKQEVRKLTREQIGDKAPKVREFTKTFKSYLPAFYKFMKWSEICLHPFTNGESVKLSGKLSDRSLR